MFEGHEIAVWALLIIASITDLLRGKIYNLLTFPFLFAGLGYRFYGSGRAGIDALTAVALSFILFFPLYRMKAFAAGDVKLMMAIAAWTNTQIILSLGALAVLVGALVGVIVLLRQAGLEQSVSSLMKHLKGTQKGSHRMPFAPAFLCGYLLLKISEYYQWSLL